MQQNNFAVTYFPGLFSANPRCFDLTSLRPSPKQCDPFGGSETGQLGNFIGAFYTFFWRTQERRLDISAYASSTSLSLGLPANDHISFRLPASVLPGTVSKLSHLSDGRDALIFNMETVVGENVVMTVPFHQFSVDSENKDTIFDVNQENISSILTAEDVPERRTVDGDTRKVCNIEYSPCEEDERADFVAKITSNYTLDISSRYDDRVVCSIGLLSLRNSRMMNKPTTVVAIKSFSIEPGRSQLIVTASSLDTPDRQTFFCILEFRKFEKVVDGEFRYILEVVKEKNYNHPIAGILDDYTFINQKLWVAVHNPTRMIVWRCGQNKSDQWEKIYEIEFKKEAPPRSNYEGLCDFVAQKLNYTQKLEALKSVMPNVDIPSALDSCGRNVSQKDSIFTLVSQVANRTGHPDIIWEHFHTVVVNISSARHRPLSFCRLGRSQKTLGLILLDEMLVFRPRKRQELLGSLDSIVTGCLTPDERLLYSAAIKLTDVLSSAEKEGNETFGRPDYTPAAFPEDVFMIPLSQYGHTEQITFANIAGEYIRSTSEVLNDTGFEEVLRIVGGLRNPVQSFQSLLKKLEPLSDEMNSSDPDSDVDYNSFSSSVPMEVAVLQQIYSSIHNIISSLYTLASAMFILQCEYSAPDNGKVQEMLQAMQDSVIPVLEKRLWNEIGINWLFSERLTASLYKRRIVGMTDTVQPKYMDSSENIIESFLFWFYQNTKDKSEMGDHSFFRSLLDFSNVDKCCIPFARFLCEFQEPNIFIKFLSHIGERSMLPELCHYSARAFAAVGDIVKASERFKASFSMPREEMEVFIDSVNSDIEDSLLPKAMKEEIVRRADTVMGKYGCLCLECLKSNDDVLARRVQIDFSRFVLGCVSTTDKKCTSYLLENLVLLYLAEGDWQNAYVAIISNPNTLARKHTASVFAAEAMRREFQTEICCHEWADCSKVVIREVVDYAKGMRFSDNLERILSAYETARTLLSRSNQHREAAKYTFDLAERVLLETRGNLTSLDLFDMHQRLLSSVIAEISQVSKEYQWFIDRRKMDYKSQTSGMSILRSGVKRSAADSFGASMVGKSDRKRNEDYVLLPEIDGLDSLDEGYEKSDMKDDSYNDGDDDQDMSRLETGATRAIVTRKVIQDAYVVSACRKEIARKCLQSEGGIAYVREVEAQDVYERLVRSSIFESAAILARETSLDKGLLFTALTSKFLDNDNEMIVHESCHTPEAALYHYLTQFGTTRDASNVAKQLLSSTKVYNIPEWLGEWLLSKCPYSLLNSYLIYGRIHQAVEASLMLLNTPHTFSCPSDCVLVQEPDAEIPFVDIDRVAEVLRRIISGNKEPTGEGLEQEPIPMSSEEAQTLLDKIVSAIPK